MLSNVCKSKTPVSRFFIFVTIYIHIYFYMHVCMYVCIMLPYKLLILPLRTLSIRTLIISSFVYNFIWISIFPNLLDTSDNDVLSPEQSLHQKFSNSTANHIEYVRAVRESINEYELYRQRAKPARYIRIYELIQLLLL